MSLRLIIYCSDSLKQQIIEADENIRLHLTSLATPNFLGFSKLTLILFLIFPSFVGVLVALSLSHRDDVRQKFSNESVVAIWSHFVFIAFTYVTAAFLSMTRKVLYRPVRY